MKQSQLYIKTCLDVSWISVVRFQIQAENCFCPTGRVQKNPGFF